MDWHGWFTLALVAATLATLVFTRLAPDLVLMGVLVLLLVSGTLEAPAALIGFSNSGVITVAALFVVAAGLRSTGAVDVLVERFFGRPTTDRRALARLSLPVIGASAFLNNTPLVATLIPAVTRWSKLIDVPVSRLLMPLSYASILGGTITMIGTSTNLVVNGTYQTLTGNAGFALFDIAPVGLVVAGVGFLFLVGLIPFLLPARDSGELVFSSAKQFTLEVAVANDGPLVGKTIAEAGLRGLRKIYLMEIERRGAIISAVPSEERLQGGDRLVFAGETNAIVDLLRMNGLVPSDAAEPVIARPFPERVLLEAVVSPTCEGVGLTIRDGRFRDRYGAVILAVARDGNAVPGNLGSIVLRPGDLLLLEARPAFVTRQRGESDFLVVSEIEDESANHGKALIAWVILGGLVGATAIGVTDMLTAALVGAGAMVLTGCLNMNQARRSIDLSVILTIAGSFAIGTALDKTGAAKLLADQMLVLAADDALMLLIVTYVTVSLLTEIITNNAAALIVLPITLSFTQTLGLNAEPYVVAVMFAASASFATPLGYQTNLMVYGPGGYRFSDFFRAGIPLNIIAGIATLTMIPLVWPLR
jgi:di/tricarboxylate transporter